MYQYTWWTHFVFRVLGFQAHTVMHALHGLQLRSLLTDLSLQTQDIYLMSMKWADSGVKLICSEHRYLEANAWFHVFSNFIYCECDTLACTVTGFSVGRQFSSSIFIRFYFWRLDSGLGSKHFTSWTISYSTWALVTTSQGLRFTTCDNTVMLLTSPVCLEKLIRSNLNPKAFHHP